MKKIWFSYFAGAAALLAAAVLAGVFSRLAGGVFSNALLAAAFAAIIVAVWWTVYFAKIYYRLDNAHIIIQSGIAFQRSYTIPKAAILAETTFYLRLSRKNCIALFTVLHTAGKRFVIFAEFSTNR